MNTKVYVNVKDHLLESIERDFVRNEAARLRSEAKQAADKVTEAGGAAGAHGSNASGGASGGGGAKGNAVAVKSPFEKPAAMHDTEGWKSLETSFLALQRIMDGAGSAFSEYVDDVMPLIRRGKFFVCLFVGFFFCGLCK